MGNRAQRRVVLDRLVGGAILAQADRVVRPHPQDRQAHERREPHAWAHVVGEDQERRAVWLDDPAVGGGAVDDRPHPVLADPEWHVAPRVHARERPRTHELGLGRLHEIGGPTDHRRSKLRERRHRLVPGGARGERLAGGKLRQRPWPALAQLAPPGAVPVGRLPREGGAPGLKALLGPRRLCGSAALAQRHVLVDALVDPEVAIRIEAHRFLGGAHLVLSQRRPVCGGGIDRMWSRVGDV